MNAELLLAENRAKAISVAMDMEGIESCPDRVKIKCQALILVLCVLTGKSILRCENSSSLN